jgi:hypothetical protein
VRGGYQTDEGRNVEKPFETLGVVPAKLSELNVFDKESGRGLVRYCLVFAEEQSSGVI